MLPPSPLALVSSSFIGLHPINPQRHHYSAAAHTDSVYTLYLHSRRDTHTVLQETQTQNDTQTHTNTDTGTTSTYTDTDKNDVHKYTDTGTHTD